MAPEVSVIVPVHNQEKYLGRCLRSLMAQNLERELFEIIVIDDGSSDRSHFAADVFSDEIRLIEHEANRGLPASLNAGIGAARGSLVVRVDADDYVSVHFLSVLRMYLHYNADIDAVACDYFLVNDDESRKERRSADDEPIACGIMFRRQQLIDVGLYDEDFLTHEDRDLRKRFLASHQIHRVPIPLYRYRRHADNMTNDEARSREYLQLLEKKHGAEV